MAIRIICCSNLPAPPICKRRVLMHEEDDRPRRLTVPRATIGLASVMIGLEMLISIHGDVAVAEPMKPSPPPPSYRVAKWSDRRMCPPWRVNSLESIVPENLPRPNSRRRWDNVSSPAAAAAIDAPPLKSSGGRFSGDCFSM